MNPSTNPHYRMSLELYDELEPGAFAERNDNDFVLKCVILDLDEIERLQRIRRKPNNLNEKGKSIATIFKCAKVALRNRLKRGIVKNKFQAGDLERELLKWDLYSFIRF
ncbi:unnamed protein product [Caenorhabditis sp. 36 PRJEB53466]|nr:unnamed protein product [Caenorhabditis sp. 36 PRJEB53466]